MDNVHPLVHSHTQKERERIRDARCKGQLASSSEGDYVLVAREDFFEGEKLCLRWCGPRRVVKALREYVFRVEDLRNGKLDDVHGTRLKVYRDDDLDHKAILFQVFSSETDMSVARLLRLVDQDGDLYVAVRWKRLSAT